MAKEAAKRLFGDWYISTSGKLCVDEGDRDAFCEAIGMAVTALRAQQAKLDRNRWEGYDWCNEYGLVAAAFDGWSYCNRCGKPLTKEAWAELERRINGGTTD